MAKIHFGTALYGRLKRNDGTTIATRFFHISYLPLVPLGSFRVTHEDGQSFRGQPAGFQPLSVASGYFKVWGFLAALGLTALGVTYADRSEIPWSEFLLVPGLAIVLMAAVIASWLWLGTGKPRRKRHVPILALGLPLLVMVGFFGYWWWDRYDRDQRYAASAREEEAQRQAERERDQAAYAAEQREHDALAHIAPTSAGQAVKARQRVLARWSDGNWWPAQVKRVSGSQVKVRFDDRTVGDLAAEAVAPMPAPALLDAEALALCKWSSTGRWWRARVTGRDADSNDVRYIDGSTRTVSAGECVPAK